MSTGSTVRSSNTHRLTALFAHSVAETEVVCENLVEDTDVRFTLKRSVVEEVSVLARVEQPFAMASH